MIKLTIFDPYGELVGNLWSDCESVEKFHQQFQGVINLFSRANAHFEIEQDNNVGYKATAE